MIQSKPLANHQLPNKGGYPNKKKGDRHEDAYLLHVHRLLSNVEELRVLVVGDDYMRRVRLGRKNLISYHIDGGWHPGANTVQVPPNLMITQVGLRHYQLGRNPAFYLGDLTNRFLNTRPRSLQDYLDRSAGNPVTRRLPPPHLIIIIAGLHDIEHQIYAGNGAPPVQPFEKRNFVNRCIRGIENLRNDVDPYGTSLALWAGFGRASNVIGALNRYHLFTKDRVGGEDWPNWLHYRCFVGSEMDLLSYDPQELQDSGGRAFYWSTAAASAACTQLMQFLA